MATKVKVTNRPEQVKAQRFLENVARIREAQARTDRLLGRDADPEVKKQLVSLDFQQSRYQEELREIESEYGINNYAQTSVESIGINSAISSAIQSNNDYIESLSKDLEKAKKRLKSISRRNRASSEDHPLIEVAKKELEKAKSRSKKLTLREDDSTVLSKEDIMALNHEDRARMLDENNKDNYTEEQLRVIDDLKSSLGKDGVQKMIRAAQLSTVIQGSKDAFDYNVKHPEMLKEYIDNMKRRAVEQLTIARDNKIYTNFKYALDGQEDNKSKINYIHNNLVSSNLLERYLSEYPEYEDTIRPLIPLIKSKEDLLNLIMLNQSANKETRKNAISIVHLLSKTSPSRDYFLGRLNTWMDDHSDSYSEEVALLNSLLKENEELNQLRDSTVADSIEQKLRRKKEKQEREEEERRKKAEEDERRRIEEENKKQTESLVISKEDYNEASDFMLGVLKGDLSKYNTTYGDSGKYKDDQESKERAKLVIDKYNQQSNPTDNNIPELQSVEDIDISDTTEEETQKTTETRKDIESVERITSIEDIYIGEELSTEEQVNQAYSKKSDVDVDVQQMPALTQESTTNKEQNTLLGNLKFRYDSKQAANNKKELRKGNKEDDPMSQFFAWMDSAGITYQETIDLYLNDIAKTDPDVQFLMVTPNENSTNDSAMKDVLLTVVEYNSKVERIYRNPGNNVVEFNGKKYLVIGNLGFADSSDQFREVLYAVKRHRTEYFNSNKEERFYVDPLLKTKIKNMDWGHVIHEQEHDTEEKFRQISELINDPKRNPRNQSLSDLKWGIVINGKFVTVNGSNIEVKTPENLDNHLGNTYLLIKASDGTYIPILVFRKTLSDIKEGGLKNLINANIENLTSNNTKVQEKALIELRNRIYFPRGTNIKVTTDERILVTSNNITTEFNPKLPDFNKEDFIKRVNDLNPAIAINVATLLDENMLSMYDAAGALTVDLGQLYTSNAGYTVYAIDTSSGSILRDTPTEEEIKASTTISSTTLPEVAYNGKKYVKTDKGYTLDGKLITNSSIIQKLEWMTIIMNSTPSYVQGTTQYYILDNNSDNPIIIKYDTVYKVPNQLKNTIAREILDKVNSNRLKNNAKTALQENAIITESQKEVVQDIAPSGIELLDILEGNESAVKEDDSSSIVTSDQSNYMLSKQEDIQITASINVQDLLFSEEFGDRFQDILESKEWDDMPEDINQLESYLINKGIDATNIVNVETFLDMLEHCK